MGESLTQRRRVREEVLRDVNRCQGRESPLRWIDLPQEVTANSVPAAAVRQRWLALFGITGLKACVGGSVSIL